MENKVICMGYARADGKKGVRNKVLVLYTVECSKHVCEQIGRYFEEKGEDVDVVGSLACLDNQVVIRRMLRYSIHPNVGGVLIVGHGCEYIRPEKIAAYAQAHGREQAWFYLQEAGGTEKGIQKGIHLVQEMLAKLKAVERTPMYAHELIVGAKCGGSDFTSGLTGNSLVGHFFDSLVGLGGTAMMEEMGEAIALKEYLCQRAVNEKAKRDIAMTYDKTVAYCKSFGQFSISPGNFVGGLTTIEEKSMGAVVKSGTSPIEGILKIAQKPPRPGFWILDVIPDYRVEPGFYQGGDATGLMDQIASDCHLLLFVTGRGHVGGTPISPVIKITGNERTYEKLEKDIDLSASGLLDGSINMQQLTEQLWEKVEQVCSGERSCAERVGHKEGTLFFNYQHPEQVVPYTY